MILDRPDAAQDQRGPTPQGVVLPFPNRMADREPWVSKSQVAKRYQLSTKTIERWIGMGCPSRKVQGKRVLQLSAVDAWLSEERSA